MVRSLFCSRARGASLVEYALLVALISVVCLAAARVVGRGSARKLCEAANKAFDEASSACVDAVGPD